IANSVSERLDRRTWSNPSFRRRILRSVVVTELLICYSAQLAQQRDQGLALLGIERRERLLRDRERVRRRLFGHLLPGARQADQQTSTIFGVGAGLGQAAGGEPRPAPTPKIVDVCW